MGYKKRKQLSNTSTYSGEANNKRYHIKSQWSPRKPKWNIPIKDNESRKWCDGRGCFQITTKTKLLTRGVLTTHGRTALPKIQTIRGQSRRLWQIGLTNWIQPKGWKLATCETNSDMVTKAQDTWNVSRKESLAVGKQRKSPVRDALRERPEVKPFIMENYYAARNYIEILVHENNHIIVKVHLYGKQKKLLCIQWLVEKKLKTSWTNRFATNMGSRLSNQQTQGRFTYLMESQELHGQSPIQQRYLWTLVAIGNW